MVISSSPLSLSLPPPWLQTQNPGLYYHQAALAAIERKKLNQKICVEPLATPPHSLPEVTYYGQRPWRLGLTSE